MTDRKLSGIFRNGLTSRLYEILAKNTDLYRGESGRRKPVHTLYGGAHLFKAETAAKLGKIAVNTLNKYSPDSSTIASILDLSDPLAEKVFNLVNEKLRREPIEDLRIDFEDGYGFRPDEEEDGHAIDSAMETAKALATNALPPFFGIRIKALTSEASERSLSTLDLYLSALLDASNGKLPANFVVTLPKVQDAVQVAILTEALDELERLHQIENGTIKLEIMVETTRSIIGPDGASQLPAMVRTANGRCRGAHFGAYDFTAECSVTSAYQDLLHPLCEHARAVMQSSLGGTGVWLSDGATNVMPIGPHRGDDLTDEQHQENISVVHRAWRLHYDHCRHSLANGFYQGWDLHPAQLPTRYAALYAFFIQGLDEASSRLKNFLDKAAQATLAGDVFDDAATGQGLLNYFLRALNCGAMTEKEVLEVTGLTREELRTASFAAILSNRRQL